MADPTDALNATWITPLKSHSQDESGLLLKSILFARIEFYPCF